MGWNTEWMSDIVAFSDPLMRRRSPSGSSGNSGRRSGQALILQPVDRYGPHLKDNVLSDPSLLHAEGAIGCPNRCESKGFGRYQIEVLDLVADPGLASIHDIVAIPKLVKRSPGPSRRVIGDLNDPAAVLAGLDLAPIAGISRLSPT